MVSLWYLYGIYLRATTAQLKRMMLRSSFVGQNQLFVKTGRGVNES
jgi:hypothetical protein